MEHVSVWNLICIVLYNAQYILYDQMHETFVQYDATMHDTYHMICYDTSWFWHMLIVHVILQKLSYDMDFVSCNIAHDNLIVLNFSCNA